jgi:hypothetical protein
MLFTGRILALFCNIIKLLCRGQFSLYVICDLRKKFFIYDIIIVNTVIVGVT